VEGFSVRGGGQVGGTKGKKKTRDTYKGRSVIDYDHHAGALRGKESHRGEISIGERLDRRVCVIGAIFLRSEIPLGGQEDT